MSAPTGKPNPFDAFGIAASMEGWCCLLKAARELRDVDAELMDTLLETHASGGMALDGDAAAKVRNFEGFDEHPSSRTRGAQAEATRDLVGTGGGLPRLC
ncbi:hypothetical protein [Methylobacterium nonmethylotrophicum]|uniref:hypothetical protein n=1 Tax=Methylobacterium nonmethylotrophicum TaxID=1141884 RepID=UPI00315CCF58